MSSRSGEGSVDPRWRSGRSPATPDRLRNGKVPHFPHSATRNPHQPHTLHLQVPSPPHKIPANSLVPAPSPTGGSNRREVQGRVHGADLHGDLRRTIGRMEFDWLARASRRPGGRSSAGPSSGPTGVRGGCLLGGWRASRRTERVGARLRVLVAAAADVAAAGLAAHAPHRGRVGRRADADRVVPPAPRRGTRTTRAPRWWSPTAPSRWSPSSRICSLRGTIRLAIGCGRVVEAGLTRPLGARVLVDLDSSPCEVTLA